MINEIEDIELKATDEALSKYSEDMKGGVDVGSTSFTIDGMHVSYNTSVVSMYGKIGGGKWSYVYSQGGAGNGVFFDGTTIELTIPLAQGVGYLVKYYRNWVTDIDEKLKNKNFDSMENVNETASASSGAMQMPQTDEVVKQNNKFVKVIQELDNILVSEAKSASNTPKGNSDYEETMEDITNYQKDKSTDKNSRVKHGYSNRDRVENYSGGMEQWEYDFPIPEKFVDNLKKANGGTLDHDLFKRAKKRHQAEKNDSRGIISLGSNFQFDNEKSGEKRGLAFEGLKIPVVKTKAATLREAFEKTPQMLKEGKQPFGILFNNHEILFEHDGKTYNAKKIK